MKTFNKFMVGARGNGNITISNPSPIYTREDALNLCAWIKIIACISDEELDQFEDEASQGDKIPTQPDIQLPPKPQVGRTPNPPIPTTMRPSPTLRPAAQTPQTLQRRVSNPGYGMSTSITIPEKTNHGIGKCKSGHTHIITWTLSQRIRVGNPAKCPTCGDPWAEIRAVETPEIISQDEAPTEIVPVSTPSEPHDILTELAEEVMGTVESAVSTVEKIAEAKKPAGTPGFGKCRNGHEHPVTFTVNNRIRQATPHRCPDCGLGWTELRPA